MAGDFRLNVHVDGYYRQNPHVAGGYRQNQLRLVRYCTRLSIMQGAARTANPPSALFRLGFFARSVFAIFRSVSCAVRIDISSGFLKL
jgi:hypothetical protein